MASAVVFGGYGTFGSLVARELARRGLAVVIAGRDRGRAEALARELGPVHRGIVADVGDADSCRAALAGQAVAVHCAGPYAAFGDALLDVCLELGCHYADLADERGYVARVRGRDDAFRRRGLAAVWGCSTLPALSGALALRAHAGQQKPPRHARVSLFIGNDNPKGQAAIRTFMGMLGKPFAGRLRGFRDREVVALPHFGKRAVFNVESPEYDLFGDLLGVESVVVKVGFELRLSTYGMALLAALPLRYGERSANLMAWIGNRFRWLGTSGAAVMTELFYADGTVRSACLLARANGQRMGALPCALAVESLCSGPPTRTGTLTAYELLGHDALLRQIAAEGYELVGPG